MTCCLSYTFPINGQLTTDIVYSETMKEQLGGVPKIDLYYLVDDEFVLQTGVEILFDENSIHIDHGGPAIGIVKIS